MEVTRTSLRAARDDQAIPEQISQRQKAVKKIGRYAENIERSGDTQQTQLPTITTKKVENVSSEQKAYTEDAIKTALEKLDNYIVSRFGRDSSSTDPTKPSTGAPSGGGKGKSVRDFFSGLTNDQLGLLSTQQLVDRDNEMYGDTFPEGSFSPTDTGAMVNRDKMLYGDTFPKGSFNITPPSLGQKQAEKTYEQNRLKEGEKFADRGEREGVNASGFQQANVPGSAFNTGKDESQRPRQTVAALPSDYKETEAKAFLDAKAYQALKDSGLDKTVGGEDAQVNVGSGSLGTFGLGTFGKGAPSGDDLKLGSFGISTIKREDQAERMGGQGGLPLGTTTQRQDGTVKDGIKVAKKESPAVNLSNYKDNRAKLNESRVKTVPKQTVASLPSNYKSTEAAAFAKAKSYKDSKAKGDAAAKATNTPSKPPAGSFGISAAGKKQAEANKAEKKAAPKKPTPAQKTAVKKSTTVKKSSTSTSKSGRKSNTGSKKSSRGGKSGGGSSKGGGSKGGSKGTSGSKKASRGAKGGGTSKGGSFGGKRRRSNTKRSRRRCDIRCKFDISILTNQNLIRDDLADVAYFVKDLQGIN